MKIMADWCLYGTYVGYPEFHYIPRLRTRTPLGLALTRNWAKQDCARHEDDLPSHRDEGKLFGIKWYINIYVV